MAELGIDRDTPPLPPREVCYRNAILCGELSWLCLVCERSLSCARAVRTHLQEELHRSALAANQHLDKFPGERIRKLKNLYYCETCNMTITNAAKVQIHISSEQHRLQKSSPHDQTETASHVTRAGDGVIAFGSLLVGDKAWNGIVGESCVLCDMDTEDWSVHVKTVQHLVNLIRLKTCSGTNNFYRKINKYVIHCLTCNQAVRTSMKHFESDNHRKLYNECKKAKDKVDERDLSNLEKEFEKVIRKDLLSGKEPESEEADKLGKDSNTAKEERDNREKIQETKCVKTVNGSAQVIDESELDLPIKDVKAYATNNYINYKKKCSFCRPCQHDLNSTLERLQEHVSGKKHKASVARMGDKDEKVTATVPYIPLGNALQLLRTPDLSDSAPRSINSRKYIRSGVQVFEPEKMVINESICIEMFSFQYFHLSEDGLLCLICGIETHDPGHVNGDRHISRVLDSNVLIIDTEFIRAVPAGYHCGFCHELARSWPAMKEHLQSPRHGQSKARCEQELQKYLPVVKGHLRRLNPWDGPLSGTSVHGGIYLPF